MSRYAFTRAHARGLLWAGWILFTFCVIGAAVLALAGGTVGIAAFLAGKGFSTAGASVVAGLVTVGIGALVGLAIATPLIVAGELILILLDQRSIALRHLRVARAIRRALRPLAPDDARPRRQRRVI